MLLYILVIVLFGSGDVRASENDPEEISNYDLPCLTFGGLCVQTDECPHDDLLQLKGLCPLQENNGVVCCRAHQDHMSKSESRCASKGGECFPTSFKCPEALTFSKATDCSDDEKCCILIY